VQQVAPSIFLARFAFGFTKAVTGRMQLQQKAFTFLLFQNWLHTAGIDSCNDYILFVFLWFFMQRPYTSEHSEVKPGFPIKRIFFNRLQGFRHTVTTSGTVGAVYKVSCRALSR
jgi:hypothetical protein